MLHMQLSKDRFTDEIYINSPDGIFIADSTGRYTDLNPYACEITGYTFEELTNMSLFDIIHPDSGDEVLKSFENLKSKGKISEEFKFIKKDGTVYYMQVDAVKFDDNAYFGFCKDTTKHKLSFERFGQVDSSLTRQAEGTGIGLSLVKKFVEAHEGEIKVDSEIGKRSTFTVILPIAKECKKAEEKILPEFMDDRLLQSVAIEFSDIYF